MSDYTMQEKSDLLSAAANLEAARKHLQRVKESESKRNSHSIVAKLHHDLEAMEESVKSCLGIGKPAKPADTVSSLGM